MKLFLSLAIAASAFIGVNFASAPEAQAGCGIGPCTAVQILCTDGSKDVALWSQRNLACGGSSAPQQQVITSPSRAAVATTTTRTVTTNKSTVRASTTQSNKQSSVPVALASGNWTMVRPNGVCKKGMDPNAAGATAIVDDLTWTCDVNMGGYNVKKKGTPDPVFAGKCVLREGTYNVTWTYACKRTIDGMQISGGSVLFRTYQVTGDGSRKYSYFRVTKGSFGTWSAKQVSM